MVEGMSRDAFAEHSQVTQIQPQLIRSMNSLRDLSKSLNIQRRPIKLATAWGLFFVENLT